MVTPSVSMTTAASDEPRKSFSTWRTAMPSWLESFFGSARKLLIASDAGRDFVERGHVLEAMGAAGAVIDMQPHLAARQHGRQPVRCRRASISAWASERRSASVIPSCWARRSAAVLDACVPVLIDRGHALRIVEEDHDVGPTRRSNQTRSRGNSTAA